jgi:hypothetical protein
MHTTHTSLLPRVPLEVEAEMCFPPFSKGGAGAKMCFPLFLGWGGGRVVWIFSRIGQI